MGLRRVIGKLDKVALALLAGVLFWQCDSGPKSGKAGEDPRSFKIIGEEEAVLTAPPEVPPPIQRDHATRVIVRMDVIEKEMRLSDGVSYTFWTFGGTVPGSFIRIREGDVVEFHLSNHPNNKLPHNIDLHAVTGPGGGAASSFTAPGHETQFSFQALNPGLYIYHCATAPVGMHIANGMYGLILVEPAEGLPPVDREYYVLQSEFYTEGAYGEEGHQAFQMEKALKEIPDYVVFNGSVGALTEKGALQAKVGETIRLYVGNGGPNLISSFHVIGEIFDVVYTEGGTVANQKNVQTTLVPAGGSAMVEFKVDVPGELILVDHSIFRAFNKGALGVLEVEGTEDKQVYSGLEQDRVYMPEGSTIQSIKEPNDGEAPTKLSKQEKMERGERIYRGNCAACHQPDGKGLASAFPPVANSDYLMEDKERSIRVLLEGLDGEITVNGKKYNSIMPQQLLSDADVASVLTYIRNSMGNSGEPVSIEEVSEVRKTLKK